MAHYRKRYAKVISFRFIFFDGVTVLEMCLLIFFFFPYLRIVILNEYENITVRYKPYVALW